MTKRQKELLLKARYLHMMMETHPYMSRMQTDRAKDMLDDLILNGHELNSIDKSLFRIEPEIEDLEEIL